MYKSLLWSDKYNLFIACTNVCCVDFKLNGFVKHASRDDSKLVFCQWQTSLQSNAISHWLGANLKLALASNPRQLTIITVHLLPFDVSTITIPCNIGPMLFFQIFFSNVDTVMFRSLVGNSIRMNQNMDYIHLLAVTINLLSFYICGRPLP